MKKSNKAEQICLNCHFLTKTYVDTTGREHRLSWSAEDRETRAIEDHYSAECAKGVWSTRVADGLNQPLEAALGIRRGENCFYIKAQPSMLFDAAAELQRLRSANRELKQSYRYTQAGLWLAALGLVSSAIATLLL